MGTSGPESEPAIVEFTGIGVPWWVRSDVMSPVLLQRLQTRVDAYDAGYSRFRADSPLGPGGVLAGGGSVTLGPEAVALGELYADLAELTDGAMTPFIGGSLERLGYDSVYTLKPSGDPVAAPVWGAAPGASTAPSTSNSLAPSTPSVSWTGSTISSDTPVTVDIGAMGKGQLIDLVASELIEAGATEFLIDGSGDLRRSGPASERIGLEHPFRQGKAIGVIDLGTAALAASAGNRRSWGEGLHHILDGRTGQPVRSVVATWVLAPTALLADALATALFFVPGSVVGPRYEVDWLTIHSDGRAEGTGYFLEGLF